MATKKYLSLDKLTEYDALIKDYVDAQDSAQLSKLSGGSVTVKNAQNATHATSADSATNASYATSAGSASTASSATKLATARSISLSGDATGSASFDGSANAAITVTVADDSHNHVISNVDGLQTALNGKASSSHNHDSAYYSKSSGDSLASTVADIKEDVDAFFLDASFTANAKDTLKEIQDYIDSDVTVASNLTASIAGKANVTHSHAISDITNLQSTLDGKAASSHGTHVSYSTTAPVMDGTASVGTASTVARSDHKHPTDTSRASQSALDSLTSVVNGKASSSHSHSDATTSAAGFMTAAMVTKLNGIATGATKITVDSALSSTSTNPVQNKVINSNISSLTSAISANTSSITALTSRVSTLETSVNEFTEITSAEITALFA